MSVAELRKDIYAVGAQDWDRRLFDEIIPLPDGTSYNAYLIRGSEKTALLDTVDPTKEHVLLENLEKLGIRHIDYLVSHHAEQDHSGSIPRILQMFPQARVVTNPKCKELLKEMLLVADDRFIEVKDRETLSLGDRTLEFIYAPWVHWPETMFTYLREERMLFTCDFLGSHLATSEVYSKNDAVIYEGAKRYYAEIMMPFRFIISKNLEKIKDLPVDMVAPSHGPVYAETKMIFDAYRDWISDEVKNEVVLPYVSMHGSTRRMIDYFSDALTARGVAVKPFNLTHADIGKIAMALVDTATIVVGSPTFLVGPHPAAAHAVTLVNALRPKVRFMSLIGSYGWGGRLVEQITGMLSNVKVEFLEPVIARGYPKEQDFKALDRLADDIARRHREQNIVKRTTGGC